MRRADTNPFRYGALALDEAFTNRAAEVAELVADPRNGQDVVIFAPRRYGKSSLVWRVRQELVAGGVLVAHVNLMTTPTKEKLAERLARTIHEDVASVVYRAREKAVGVFRGLRITPKVTLDPNDGSLSFGFDAGQRAEDVDATLERLLQLPGELGADRNRKVVLIFDEFQEIVDLDPNLPKLMRSVFQEQPKVAHVYLGSKRHMMERIFNDENEPFWRSAKQLELSVIQPDLFRDYIGERFRATGKDIDEGAVTRILELTGGHPYATQELCYFIWAATANGRAARRETVESGLAGVLQSEHAHYSLLWESLSAGQRVVLEALAAEAGRPYTEEYRRKHNLRSATHVQKALGALRRRELVAKVPGDEYAITEPFLAEWIARTLVTAGPSYGRPAGPAA
ncbi:MAG: AAA family ATPase [Gaiellales bacterium]